MSTASPTPRMAWIVNAVLRKAGSSPRLLWMTQAWMATSDSMTRPLVMTQTIDERPKAAGNSRRVRMRLLPRRMTCWAP